MTSAKNIQFQKAKALPFFEFIPNSSKKGAKRNITSFPFVLVLETRRWVQGVNFQLLDITCFIFGWFGLEQVKRVEKGIANDALQGRLKLPRL